MLNLHQKTFSQIKKILLRQKQDIEKELKSIEADDPVKDGSLAESSEPGTDSWLADMHGRALAIRQNLVNVLSKTTKALSNLRKGSYGKCERCGKQIEKERLLAMPTATLCLSCSKLVSKKSSNNVRHK